MSGDRPRRRLPDRLRPWLLLALVVVLHGARLDGPLTDGQHGNCAGMFGLFARNAEALGDMARWVPVINPRPPADLGAAEFYTHHPPLLAWWNHAVLAVSGLSYAGASRWAALLLSWWAACLAAALVHRVGGAFAGWVAGVAMLALPAGLHHGTLVNYETVAIPAALCLWWALGRPATRAAAPTLLAGVVAALADWVALFPLAWTWADRGPRARRLAATGAAVGLAACALLFSSVSRGSLADTLAQGLAVSPLAPDFAWAPWAAAQERHLLALYGLALLPLALGALAAWVPPVARGLGLGQEARRLLRGLIVFGLFNVTVFARHATGPEHYALLMSPAVAASVALLLDGARRAGGARTGAWLATAGALLLALESGRRFSDQREARAQTSQWQQARAFATVADHDTLYLRPDGVSFVFLYAAERSFVPFPVDSLDTARAAARAHRERFHLPTGAAALVLFPADRPPAWLASRPPDELRDGFRFWRLPPG